MTSRGIRLESLDDQTDRIVDCLVHSEFIYAIFSLHRSATVGRSVSPLQWWYVDFDTMVLRQVGHIIVVN